MNNSLSTRTRVILGIDSWCGGLKYFLNLHPQFKQRGYKLVLLHFGSWGHDLNRPNHELIQGMEVYDISYFGIKSFTQILHILNPTAILFFSISAILHQSVNIYACKFKIPTIHVFHGIVSVQSIELTNLYKISLQKAFLNITSALWRNLSHVLPFFYKSLYLSNRLLTSWSLPLHMVRRRIFYESNCISPYLKTDLGFVYITSDIQVITETYGNDPKLVTVVGNLDLKEHCLQNDDVGALCILRKPQNTSHRLNVIYLDTALYHGGIIFNSPKDYLEHLLLTARALRLQSLNLYVKLHPAWTASSFPSLLQSYGIDLVDQSSTKTAILQAYSVIAEPTSLSILPAILGAKIALAKYSRLESLEYGELISSYPAAFKCYDIASYRDYVENMEIDTSRQLQWIENNKGPWPPHLFAHRVTNTIHDYLAKVC